VGAQDVGSADGFAATAMQARVLDDFKSVAQGRCDGGETKWWWKCVCKEAEVEAEVAEVVFEKARTVCCAR
jgi:hypothetical protein